MNQSVIAVYDRISAAEAALRDLDRAGFPTKQVSFVSQQLHNDDQVHGFITTHDDHIKGGAITGAWVGGIFGLVTGVAFLAVPGFGPLLAAGHLASVLLGSIEGAAIGAAGGGFLAALANCGVAEHYLPPYEAALKEGKCMVFAHGSAEEVTLAHNVLKDTGAADVQIHDQVSS
jgi:hypothetical protein